MRIDSALVPNYSHYPILSGHGYAGVHAFVAHGNGWFSNLIAHAAPMLHHAATSAAGAALQHVASGGNLQGALAAAGNAAAGSARQSLTGSGYGGRRKRGRHDMPF